MANNARGRGRDAVDAAPFVTSVSRVKQSAQTDKAYTAPIRSNRLGDAQYETIDAYVNQERRKGTRGY